jgi:hypothetical protein
VITDHDEKFIVELVVVKLVREPFPDPKIPNIKKSRTATFNRVNITWMFPPAFKLLWLMKVKTSTRNRATVLTPKFSSGNTCPI